MPKNGEILQSNLWEELSSGELLRLAITAEKRRDSLGYSLLSLQYGKAVVREITEKHSNPEPEELIQPGKISILPVVIEPVPLATQAV